MDIAQTSCWASWRLHQSSHLSRHHTVDQRRQSTASPGPDKPAVPHENWDCSAPIFQKIREHYTTCPKERKQGLVSGTNGKIYKQIPLGWGKQSPSNEIAAFCSICSVSNSPISLQIDSVWAFHNNDIWSGNFSDLPVLLSIQLKPHNSPFLKWFICRIIVFKLPPHGELTFCISNKKPN